MAASPAAEAAVKKLARLPSNCVCPNCGTQKKFGFSTVCIKYFTFVCNMCKTSHQAISHRCKSLTMSSWTEGEVLQLKTHGNDHARRTWLAKAPPIGQGGRPKEGDPIDVFKSFVVDAYERKKYYSADGAAAGGQPQQPTTLQPPVQQQPPPPPAVNRRPAAPRTRAPAPAPPPAAPVADLLDFASAPTTAAPSTTAATFDAFGTGAATTATAAAPAPFDPFNNSSNPPMVPAPAPAPASVPAPATTPDPFVSTTTTPSFDPFGGSGTKATTASPKAPAKKPIMNNSGGMDAFGSPSSMNKPTMNSAYRMNGMNNAMNANSHVGAIGSFASPQMMQRKQQQMMMMQQQQQQMTMQQQYGGTAFGNPSMMGMNINNMAGGFGGGGGMGASSMQPMGGAHGNMMQQQQPATMMMGSNANTISSNFGGQPQQGQPKHDPFANL